MIALNFLAGSTTSGTAMSVESYKQKNTNTVLSNNQVQLVNPGIYEVSGMITLTSTAAGNYGLSLYANGSIYNNCQATASATASGETVTMPISSVIEVQKSMPVNNFVTLAFMPVGAPTVVGGDILIKGLM